MALMNDNEKTNTTERTLTTDSAFLLITISKSIFAHHFKPKDYNIRHKLVRLISESSAASLNPIL